MDLKRILNRSWIEKGFALIAVAVFVKWFYCLLVSMYITNYGLPQELREGVTIKLAVELAKGNNPYSIEYNELNIPVINHYGWFVSFFLSIIIRIVHLFAPVRPEMICVFVTIAVMAFGCFAMSGLVFTKTYNLFLTAISAVLALSCYWRFGLNGGVFPDSYGLTLSFILMWIIEIDLKRKKYRYQIYVLLILLMFYSKQYFVICGIGVLIWLFFINKRIACKYACFGVAVGIISIILVDIFFPLYFTEALFFSGITNTVDHKIDYAISQFQYLFESYISLFFIVLCVILTVVINALDRRRRNLEIDLHEFVVYLSNYEVIMMVLGALACMRMGQNGGAAYSYYLQIWIPYVIYVSCVCADNMLRKSNGEIGHYAALLTMVVLLFVAKTSEFFLIPNYVGPQNRQNWERVYSILDEYSADNAAKVLLCSPLSFYAIEHDYECYDYGSQQYVYYGLTNNRKFKKVFPKSDWLIERVEDTRNEAREKIIHGEFECLVIMDGNPRGITCELVEETGLYDLSEKVILQTGGQEWLVYIFLLRD